MQFSLTEKARAKLQTLRLAHPHRPPVLRISAACSACGGLAFGLEWDAEPPSESDLLQLDGWHIAIDPIARPYLEELTLDYEETPYGGAFLLLSPYGASTCFLDEP
ncbi:MAG: hypothetical protein N2561_07440 [Bacteroidetes bacterium]|nr:hypothetical protein [Rhodothermia bacterium]MCS7155140.1 hypothetical protein [Bacteroidota bacterium]MCX7907351.1 hypothetical protein [Bacteroidota bacterium]MDW8137922.1 iron-sulfur cluster biosynthesis family protein [Bacteroidota bacterium]MDW8286227.1 iron-sulfur cluster biosynthesis family protein [Bacteroidota bacterium]